MDAKSLGVCSDRELFDEFENVTRQLLHAERNLSERHPVLSWRHKNASGSLWWISEVVEEMKKRNGRKK